MLRLNGAAWGPQGRRVDNPAGLYYRQSMRRTLSFLLQAAVLAALLPVLAGCTEKITRQSKLADTEIFARGSRLYAGKDFGAAADHFQVLLEKYPASPIAGRAQLMLADARMERGDAIEAETAFDDFLRLYPSDDNVPYALFRKGELLSRDAVDPGRDQSKTGESIRAFELFLQKEPVGPRAAQAHDRIRSLRARLAEHELLIVRHYLKRKLPESAAVRAKRAAADYPDTPAVPVLLSLQADALDRLGKTSESAAVRATLANRFPGFTGGKK
jgi:outer membrane assembly lipoprotein YfiO